MKPAGRVLLAALLALCARGAGAQLPEPPPAADLREEVQRIEVTVEDLYGRREAGRIAVTHFRPPGDGPFPLLILSHGRATPDKRHEQGRQRFEAQARYFSTLGFAVLVPTRLGYGETRGVFDPEHAGDCQAMRPAAAAAAASEQVLATLAHARTLPWVDASRWVAVGQSVGGLTTLATASRRPPGLVAALNFAGGHGGRPDTHPGDSCSPAALSRLWREQGGRAGDLPTLWLYWANDRYFGGPWPRRWAEAWREGGGQAEFHELPAFGIDGHGGFGADMDHWVPLAEAFLAQAGFTRSGVVPRPPATAFAPLQDVEAVPTTAASRENLYRRFLAAAKPRAFAVGPGGAAGFASGDWALGRALGFCQARRGRPCRLYAVDDEVVWQP